MKTISLTDQEAREYFTSGTDSLKKKLADCFGEKFFSEKITDRVSTFDDILSISGRTLESLTHPGDLPHEIARRKAELIAEVYNEGVVLDPMNTDQYKYYPWFEITPGSGFGLSYFGYGSWYTHTFVGVRLCFKSAGLAIDAGKKFTDIYAEMLIK